MKITVILTMTLTDENDEPLSASAAHDALADADAAIRSRLFGEGFLPGDVLVDSYDITGRVEDEA